MTGHYRDQTKNGTTDEQQVRCKYKTPDAEEKRA